MPLLDVVDETFVLAPVAELRDIFCGENAWRTRGPDMHCCDDRGVQGKRLTLSGELTGTAEVWLEQAHGGVVVHFYLRADPVKRVSGAQLGSRYGVRPTQWVLDVKTDHDMARPAGTPPASDAKIPGHGETTKEH